MPRIWDEFKSIRVVKVLSPSQIVLNVGTNEKVSIGDEYIVYGLSEDEIIDPETNRSLGRLEIFRGIGTVIYVQDTMCILQATSQSALGMLVAGWRENSFNNAEVNDYAKPNATKRTSS